MNHYLFITLTLGGLSVLAALIAIANLTALALPAGRAWLADALEEHLRHPLAWAWLVALAATAGSLYFSEIVGFLPCHLCWYQRILMYPLVLVLGVGLLRGDGGVWRYGLPLALLGAPISWYHVALQYRPSLEVISCAAGAPCSARYLAVFGFVSIPVMAGTGFLIIFSLLLTVRFLDGQPAAQDELD